MHLSVTNSGADKITSFPNDAFFATLPATIPTWSPRNAQDHMNLANPSENRIPNGPVNPRRTVLIVVDFDDTRLLLRTWFERRGFRVIEAENGVQAIHRAETEAPDLIIMDVQMPKLDGLAATRQIRSVQQLRFVPIVAVSAYGAEQFRDLALAAGCNEYVSTPFEPAALENIVRALVQ